MDPSSPPPGNMGAMESLPEHRTDMWWGDHPRPARTCDQQVQTETTSENDGATSIAFCSETELMERLQMMETVHNDEISNLISKHETEIKALSNVLSVSEHENKILQSETQTVKLSSQNREIEYEELKKQIIELNNLKEKIKHYENECQRLQSELDESHVANSTVVNSQLVLNVGDTELSALKMKLKEAMTENDCLKAEVTKLETADMEGFKVKLEESVAECRKLKEEIADSKELRGQLLEAQADVERLTNQLRTEESRSAAELETRMQQAKWEMSSLQTCVDNLLKENNQLRNDLTQISHTVNESRDKFTTNELYVEKLTEQVTALKDVVSIGKQMLGMRDNELEQLQRKVQNLEDMLETEREKNTVLSSAFSPETVGNANLKKEYETQLENIRSLKDIYTQRSELMGLENQALKDTLGDKDSQIKLMEKRFNDVQSQYMPLKESFKEKEFQISELQKRVCALTEECRSYTNQLTMINNLFTELGKTDVDLEKLRELQNAMAESLTENGNDNSATNLSRVWCALSELLENNTGDEPTPVEGSEGCYKSVNTPYGPRVVISVSQTFLRLRDLILEKKSLQKEVGQLKYLNTHLETKLQQQEKRLSMVLTELKKTWGVVNKMRSQHSQLRTSEAILRYDLQQKRKVVNELKEELEYCREIWQQARDKTTESEEQWRTLRDEFASRRRHPLLADDSTEINSAESGYSDGRGEDESGSSTSDCEENTGDMTGSEPSSSSKSPDILPEISRPSSSAFTDSTISNEVGIESDQSGQSQEPQVEITKEEETQSSSTMLPSTGAIKKVVKSEDNIPDIKISEPVLSENTSPKVDVEEILDARALRLKRLEEQCSQLFKRVVRTSNMSVAISNRLEELHEHYGDTEENRESAARRRLRNSESDNPDIPKPPPMPKVIPATRLQTEADRIAEAANVPVYCDIPTSDETLEELLQNSSLDFRIPTPPPLPPDYSGRSSDRIRRRVPNILTEETRQVTESSAELASDNSITSEGQKLEATTEKEELSASLVSERQQRTDLEEQLTVLGAQLTNQGKDLSRLRADLASQKAVLGQQTEGREEAVSLLQAKQDECTELRRQLEELREVESRLRTQLGEQQEVADSRLTKLEQVQSDVNQLQESIIRLTGQKDTLFKECYALKQANRERVWQADHQVAQCSSCGVSFSLMVRRHHCRLCGKIFCGACSSHWVAAHGDSSRRTRSCSECHSKQQSETSLLPGDNSSESSLGSSQITTEGEDDTPGLAAGEDDEDEGEEEEDFSVISEEEVVLSQCVPYCPNPEILQYWKACEIQSGLTRRVSDLIAGGQSVSESVWVRAGVIFAVPLLLSAADCAPQVNVTWEFTTEPKCIAFSVLYKKDSDIPTENSSVLVPTTRVNSHLHPIKGRLRARREGLYTLLFDNSYSRFTGKKVNYTLSCEVGGGSGRSSVGPESPSRGVSKSPSRDLDSTETELAPAT